MIRTIAWKPHAKQRPRHRQGGHTYTPPATKAAEKNIADQWDMPPLEGPLRVRIELADTKFKIEILPAPEPVSRKLRGDSDNYAKTILDALNGKAWIDDKQITILEVKKT